MSGLRDYQLRAIEGLRSEMRKHRRTVLVLPTGAGKTRTARAVVQRVVESGRRVLWIVHRNELVDQAASVLPAPIGAISAGALTRPNPFAPIQVASVATLLARDERPAADFIVVDEAHHAIADDYLALLKSYENTFILGLTATPERSDGRGLGELFSGLVVGATYKQLIELGHLVPSDIIRPDKFLDPAHIAQKPLDAYLTHARGTKAIVFARSIELAELYAEEFNAAGIAARTVSAETPWGERVAALEAFKRGEVKVLTNVFALTEGVDIPDMECVILARGFGTLGPYLQAVGRAMRPAPGKTKAIVLDLRGVSWELGKPEADHVYSLDGRGIRLRDPNLYCPVCSAPREMGEGCTSCGWAPKSEPLKSDTITGHKLDRYAWMQKDDDDVRVKRLRKWILSARAQGYKDGYWRHKFHALYKTWPSKDQIDRALRDEAA